MACYILTIRDYVINKPLVFFLFPSLTARISSWRSGKVDFMAIVFLHILAKDIYQEFSPDNNRFDSINANNTL